MGCGTAHAGVIPPGLGKTKLVQDFNVLTPDSNGELVLSNVSVDFNECEEEGIYDIGNQEKALPFHCNFS